MDFNTVERLHMKTIVAYYFAGPAGNSPGLQIGFEFSKREYDTQPYIPKSGDPVALSYGTDPAQAAIFTVTNVQVILTSSTTDVFDVYVTLN